MTNAIIVGAGLAGLSAACTLAKQNIRSALISSAPSERAQSVMAEGGINGALNVMGEDDSPLLHFEDTMRGGVWLADPNAVRGMTQAAPEILRRLASIGVPFQKENGQIIQRNFGGQKKKRTAYAKSSTGKALMTALIDEVRKYEAKGLVERFIPYELQELILRDGTCEGVLVRNTYTGEVLAFEGPVILATGGYNGLFTGMTTGTALNSGDALARLFADGVELANLEFMQYHPTTAAISGKRMLVSEAARGEGGRLYILSEGQKRYFMEEKYPELGNLMPRDVISREEAFLGVQAYLDMSGISKKQWTERLSDLREEVQHYLGIDPAKQAIPVSPGIHFFMGGIAVDEEHRTNLPGLYAAGECACQYHGANRLGGNSLLGAIYGGETAAKTLLADGVQQSGGAQQAAGRIETDAVTPGFAKKLTDALMTGLGILRTEENLQKSLDELSVLEKKAANRRETERIALGRAMVLSALNRKESRGAHTRLDHPDTLERYRKQSIAIMKTGEVCLSLRDIPADREGRE